MNQSSPIVTSDIFGKFFSEYRTHYINIAYSYVHNREEAQDVVTESFMYMWEHREVLTWGENIKGYAFRCVIDRCRMLLRERKTRLQAQDNISKSELCKLETNLNTLQNDELTQKLFHTEIIKIYQQELSTMRTQTRAVFLASRLGDLTYQQIADTQHLSIRQVHTEMQRALQLLRISLNDYLCLIVLVLLAPTALFWHQ